MKQTVLLGFELGTARPVEIPVAHMVVSGMTQQAGKTTALEALIGRSGLRAITFVTKRGESAFAGGRRLPPFFRERADWVFVASLIDATLGEKNKLLRAWLMKVCRTTRTLGEVQQNVREARRTAKGFSESIYTEIEGYLDLVVPQIAQLPPVTELAIGPGLNVMDLSPYSSELQALVIRSVLEHVYEREREVITVIPEAWEFLPEGRGGPAKREAEVLIRKGASLRNFVWIDSQDLAGVWKTVVRAAAVCLVGVQREANEVKRTLANIPAGIAKPTATDVATLELGQFYACWGRHAVKTYVQPAWMPDTHAHHVALGIAKPFQPGDGAGIRRREEEQVNATEANALREENARLARENDDLRRRVEALEGRDRPADRRHAGVPGQPGAHAGAGVSDRAAGPHAPKPDAARAAARAFTPQESFDNERLYQAFKARLITEAAADPLLLRILATRPELEIAVKREVITVNGDSTRALCGRLIAEGFFDDGASSAATLKELARRGQPLSPGTLYPELDKLAAMGFLRIEDGEDDRGRPRKEYRVVPGMKVHIVEA